MSFKIVEKRSVKQHQMTDECWFIQFRGLEACETCEFKGKKECGGKNIRKKLMNNKGFKVPLEDQSKKS